MLTSRLPGARNWHHLLTISQMQYPAELGNSRRGMGLPGVGLGRVELPTSRLSAAYM
jgi:hypothetical protein